MILNYDLTGIQQLLKDSIKIQERKVIEFNIDKLNKKIDLLIKYAIFSPNDEVKRFCRDIIKTACKFNGAYPASIYNFYKSISEKDDIDFTVPAINIRTLTYDIACMVFKLCRELNTNLIIFEIARSEISYTDQRPEEYATCIYAAALKENYKGPIFLQGDHFQINRNNYFKDKEKEIEAVKSLIEEAIKAEFYNIDIDASTLVDVEKSNLQEQQYLNYEATAYFIKNIREKQPKGEIINIGAEIGEIEGKNSTVEDLNAFMNGLNSKLKELDIKDSITKISIQTGSSHGGVVLPHGRLAEVNIDFSTIEKLSEVARKNYKLAGVVQHGASTLPKKLFSKFPLHKTIEIHLATEFQNLIIDSPYFPYENDIYKYITEKYQKEMQQMTSDQFLYKYRKNALGAFKEKIWFLPDKKKKRILEAIEKFLKYILIKLNIRGKIYQQ